MAKMDIFGILVLFLQISLSFGSHFRGGSIMWKPGDSQNEVQITFKISWRRTSVFCNQTTISSRQLVSSGSMTNFNTSAAIGSMSFYCTDFSDSENWTHGEKTFNYTFSSNIVYFGYTSGDWISLINGGGTWVLRVIANFTTRSDTGGVNSSPITTMQPILRLKAGCNHTVHIPVSDADGDTVRCRKCGSSSECGGIYNSFPGDVNEETCVLTYQPGASVSGYYAVALQIEDFGTEDPTKALSSVPLQFLILVSSMVTTACLQKPKFISPTPDGGSCIGVQFNDSISEVIVAKVESDSVSIVDITSSSPIGLTKSNLAVYGSSGYEWYVSIHWSPMANQLGVNFFCFTAIDANGLSSDQLCIDLVGGVSPPSVTAVAPTGIVSSSQRTWTVQFDQAFVKPTASKYIYFYLQNNTLVHTVDVSNSSDVTYPQDTNGRILSITTDFYLQDNGTYYITFDRGIVKSTTYCGVESYAVNDTAFWRFTVDIDDCINVTCQNNGSCIDKVNDYICNCTTGFNGTHCENNIDDCTNVTCQNNGSCIDKVNDYICNCTTGFNGIHCENNIDDCINVICQNNGSCIDKVNDYICNCTTGFIGTHCENNIDDCINVTCQNNGSCIDKVNDYICNCTTGFNGTHCENKYSIWQHIEFVLAGSNFTIDEDTRSRAINFLISLYTSYGSGWFLHVTNVNLRIGSLIIGHTLIARQIDDVDSLIAGAMVNLSGSYVQFDNERPPVLVKSVAITSANVTVTSNSTPCEILNALEPCSSDEICSVDESGIPRCK